MKSVFTTGVVAPAESGGPEPASPRVRRVGCAVDCGQERLGGTTTQGSWRWLRRAQALDAALADK
jgi:hypothetical protein